MLASKNGAGPLISEKKNFSFLISKKKKREFYFSEIKGPALVLTRAYLSVKAMLASKNGAGPLISEK